MDENPPSLPNGVDMAKLKVAYVCQYVLWDDARNIDIDVLQSLNEKVRLRIFTQKKNLGRLYEETRHDGFDCFLIDAKKRHPACLVFDVLLKRIVGVRKFATDIALLRRFLKEYRPDVVQVEGVTPWGIITYFATRFMRNRPRVLATRHTVDSLKIPFEYDGREKSRVIYLLSKLVYRNCFVRANSWNTLQWLQASGAPRDRLLMVPVNLRQRCVFTPPAPGRDRMRFVSLSNIYPMKGLDVLIDAFAGVLKKHPEATLDLYGPDRNIKGIGSYRAYLQAKIEQHRIGHAIVFKDAVHRDKVTEVMAGYGFNISSSRGETLNLVVAEAASVSVPSITTEHTGISFWVRKHHSGFVCECTARALEQSILAAIAMTDAEYATMAGNCRHLYDDFTPETIERQLLDAYRQILERAA